MDSDPVERAFWRTVLDGAYHDAEERDVRLARLIALQLVGG